MSLSIEHVIEPSTVGNVRYLDTVVKVFENRMYQSATRTCNSLCHDLIALT